MLAENFVPWTEQWKREGFEKGVRKGREEEALKTLKSSHQTLLHILEARFGSLPDDVRRKVEAIGSVEELVKLTARVGSASDLDALGLK